MALLDYYGQPGFPALPDWSQDDPRAVAFTAPAAAPAPAPRFVPLSADPAMRAALGIVNQPDLTSRDRMLNALAAALSGIQPPPITGRTTALQALAGGLASGAARGFASKRAAKMDERKKVSEANDERLRVLNTADINEALRRRRTDETTAAAEAKARERWKVVPAAWATAAGKPELTGQRVDDGTYEGLKNTYSAWRDSQRPGRAPSTALNPDQRFGLESNKRRFGARVEQITRRMETLQKQADDPLYSDDETLQAKINALAETLAQVQDQWDRADQRVYGGGGGRRAAKPEPAAPKDVFDRDVRIALPDGRTGTLKAGSKLPAGAKVIGG